LAGFNPGLTWESTTFPGDSGWPPVFFSSLALLKITVNPSADAGSLTSHSPNFGSGRPVSCRQERNEESSHQDSGSCINLGRATHRAAVIFHLTTKTTKI
jgi:hypothetical protein